MALFRRWVNFVTYPADSNKVNTLAARTDLTNAIWPLDNGQYPSIPDLTVVGAVVTISMIIPYWSDDVFEIMEIDDIGNVTIWTKYSVWRLHKDRGLEKLLALPRNPPEE